MRISCDKEDDGYAPHEFTQRYTIKLDGIVQARVITADDVEGIIVTYALDDRGNIIEEPVGFAKRKTLKGKVTITKD